MSSCGFLASDRVSDVQRINCLAPKGGTISTVSVIVSDPSSGRSSSASVTIYVVEASAPIVKILTSKVVFNPTDPIGLIGVVSSNHSFDLTWSATVEGTDKPISLESKASTPFTTKYTSSDESSREVSLQSYLGLRPNALVERNSYVFTLSCRSQVYDNTYSTGSAKIVLTLNGRPLPGLFSVDPSRGQPLSTNFALFASNWVDENLPITYVFFLVDASTNSQLSLSPRSEYPEIQTTLPAGPVLFMISTY